ncbi:aldose epimerase family protein [Zymomonas mobilis]|uniref:Aldose 1-epimerase n=1 Tax=Zymomonas mobilis subsp. pomaceae (strain ATCC 29192 / DSM 22645 / JCM 10191 / CCUG 17912 / NBRC 13757 / NCIMB 11200 / NRRL B-4491 / Barker I) TaxID=579138 RepID=F8EUZ3_ZYMMT|nr:aldose epimerase family protein [Zymomonas mobilis]AEI37281.1 Aldose 1-epimerase [Zymomonas mobilis subsp. pomaceae ATCC 29192]MDX5948650.1 aldose epimerase family protein [Zymomonas mobilis subsp. pomaceae]GEB88455.1 aldose 1-epimerase [Zymomonas mobilis subsp. pomaceae]
MRIFSKHVLGLCFGLTLSVITFTSSAHSAPTNVSFSQAPFGKTAEGEAVSIYTLKNTKGVIVRFISYGGIIQSIETPDRDGKSGDIVLGFADLKGYTVDAAKGGLFFGALIGRYANRIAKGTYTLQGKTYNVPITATPNALHGGTRGFDKYVWTVRPLPATEHEAGAVLTLVSPDNDQGFPGTLTVHVTYTLNDQNELRLRYQATTDKPTVLNLSNHSYFNLGGEGSGSIEDEILKINADNYTPTDMTSIPTGDIVSVAGTPLDFRNPMRVGDHLRDNYPQLQYARGYDQNWVINGAYGKQPRLAAQIFDPKTGRAMDVLTSQPGLQVYTSNSLDGTYYGKTGKQYRQTDAIAFEAEHYPDSPNHPSFPTTELKPGQNFDYTTVFRFGVRR